MTRLLVTIECDSPEVQEAIDELGKIENWAEREMAQAEFIVFVGTLFVKKAAVHQYNSHKATARRRSKQMLDHPGEFIAGKT